MNELLRQERIYRLKWVIVLAVAAAGAILSTRAGAWMLAALSGVLSIYAAVRIVLSFGLARHAAFAMRGSFRRHSKRFVYLTVSDGGLHERDGELESYVPWSGVRCYFFTCRIVGIELQGQRAAYLPRRHLNPDSSSADALIAMLSSRGIARCDAREIAQH